MEQSVPNLKRNLTKRKRGMQVKLYINLRNVDSVGECFDDVIINVEQEMGSNDMATIGNIVDFITTNGEKNCPHGCAVTFLPAEKTVTYDIRLIERYESGGSMVKELGTVTWTDRKVVGSKLTV